MIMRDDDYKKSIAAFVGLSLVASAKETGPFTCETIIGKQDGTSIPIVVPEKKRYEATLVQGATGTGKTATSDQAEEIHAYIRSIIAEKYGKQVADDTTILYGGSCKASNAPELFAKPDIDGGLIGGASLKAADFKGIIDAWK